MKPLKWWLGERVVYGRRETGITMVPVIKDVIRLPQEEPEPLGQKKRRGQSKPRSRSKSAAPGGNDEAELQKFNPEEDWDDSTDPQGIVLDFLSGKEVQRRRYSLNIRWSVSNLLLLLRFGLYIKDDQSTAVNEQRILVSENFWRWRVHCSRVYCPSSWR